jgi:hypothetical protein
MFKLLILILIVIVIVSAMRGSRGPGRKNPK